MFKNLKIRNKLLMIFLVTGLIPMVILSVLAYFQSSNILEETILNQLQLFNIMVEDQFEDYFEEKLVDGDSMGGSIRVAEALEIYNQEGGDSEAWEEAYRNLNTFMPEFAERYGFLSAFLISTDGEGIYGTGEYRDRIEGADYSPRDYFQRSLAGEQNLSDFEFSDIIDDYYITVATPVRSPDTNAVLGTINGYIPIETIQQVLHQNIGEIGDSGDAYLVNAEGLLLTNTRLGAYTQDAAFVESINTEGVNRVREEIRSGNDDFIGVGIYDDYLGNSVLGSYAVTFIGNTPVGMIIELDEAEGLAPVNTLLRNLALIVVVILVIAILITLFTANTVAKPLAKIAQVVTDKFAEGDFSEELDDAAKDETGQLAKAMNRMGDKISLAMANINSASEQVAAGSKQVSDSSTDLSQGATEQASSVEELTSAIEQIASQTKANAETANKTKNLSEDTKDNAVLGNQKMQEMIGAMGEINESSKNISRIIKVIDEIAFQTNILALNAAVEAARAGQHGKGFAVVAEEVRNLAARSADAAKETTDLIEGSVRKVDEGTEIANLTAKELDKIVEAIGNVAELVEDISNASNEQSLGVEQINEGINQISDVVQTTSATSEETAAASEELSGQAELLREQVMQFKIRNVRNVNEGSNFDQTANNYYKKPSNGKEKESESPQTLDFSDKEFGKY